MKATFAIFVETGYFGSNVIAHVSLPAIPRPGDLFDAENIFGVNKLKITDGLEERRFIVVEKVQWVMDFKDGKDDKKNILHPTVIFREITIELPDLGPDESGKKEFKFIQAALDSAHMASRAE